jgi:glycosyltransferase involved in cell wall biosynthesis
MLFLSINQVASYGTVKARTPGGSTARGNSMRIMLLHAPDPLVRELNRRGHDVLACDTGQRSRSKSSRVVDGQPEMNYRSIGGRRKISLASIRGIADQVRQFRPDVLHAFSPASLAWGILGTAGLRNAPVVFSFRGITRRLRRFDPSEWITYLSPRIAMHACESHAVMNAMLDSGIQRDKCRVVYNVHPDFTLMKPAEAWRSEWGIEQDAWVIGVVANVRPVKGVDLLLRAAMRMIDLPKWRLVILGNIYDEEVVRLSKQPELKGRIVLPGYIKQAPAAMTAFDVFAMPSRSEGLCRSLIEAMSLGICPVVSSAGGMKELVRHEHDGLVFPVEDVESLHAALRRLYQECDLRNRLGLSGRDRVRTICAPSVVAEKLESMYRLEPAFA